MFSSLRKERTRFQKKTNKKIYRIQNWFDRDEKIIGYIKAYNH